MNAGFYKRFIPPRHQVTAVSKPSRPEKKRKIDSTPERQTTPTKDRKTSKNHSLSISDSTNVNCELDHTGSPLADTSDHAQGRGGLSNTKFKTIETKFRRDTNLSANIDQSTVLKVANSLDLPDKDVPAHGLEPIPQPTRVPDLPPVSLRSTLPDWIQNPIQCDHAIELFKDLPLSDQTKHMLDAKGLQSAFPIQATMIRRLSDLSAARMDGDLCVSASTGSGKTLAYVLPMIDSLRRRNKSQLRGVVVVPTRELLSQVKECFDAYSTQSGLKIEVAVGSRPLGEECKVLMRRSSHLDEAGRRNFRDESPTNDYISDVTADISHREVCGVDILICTSGRLIEHLENTPGFTLHSVEWLILDEADQLLNDASQTWIEQIETQLNATPQPSGAEELVSALSSHRRKRIVRKILLSATMTTNLAHLSKLRLRFPKFICLDQGHPLEELGPEDGTMEFELPSGLEEQAVAVTDVNTKPIDLLHILKYLKITSISSASKKDNGTGESLWSRANESDTSSEASSSPEPLNVGTVAESLAVDTDSGAGRKSATELEHGVLVFARDSESVSRLSRLLSIMEPSLADKIGILTKSVATSRGARTLKAFRQGKKDILIATDRASRGLDIEHLHCVINYDVPPNQISYVHRVGRAARAGRHGLAITMLAHHEARWFWREIARSKDMKRKSGKMASRLNLSMETTDQMRSKYEQAIRQLGQEVRG